jgi:hypothetical protein
MKLWFKLFLILILFPFISVLIYNTFSSRNYQSELLPKREFTGKNIYNPYPGAKKHWKKIALHLHSNQVFFSWLRHTPKEIYNGYNINKYDGVVITDYMQVTDISSLQGWNLPGYEWGCNPKKKHLLSLGTKIIPDDKFPIFSTLKNNQWSINQLKNTGAFVVFNHPSLNNAFDEEDAVALSGFNAIEVISVFGDTIHNYDAALSSGRPVFAMSTDDLHYFSDSVIEQIDTSPIKNLFHKATRFGKESGESMKRFIFVDMETVSAEELFKKLCSGSYLSIEKLHSGMPDPEVEEIGLKDDNTIFTNLLSRGKIQFIGKSGKVLKEIDDTKYAEFTIPETEPYVRLTIINWNNLVLSNPFFRYNEEKEIPGCRKN